MSDSDVIRAYMAVLAKKKAARMTKAQRRAHALKMNAARWGKTKGETK